MSIIAMIKLTTRWFSTLRFPEHYVRTFELSRQLRSCISLEQLADFVSRHDAAIKEVGKTILLEHFNEFPLNFSYRSMNSPLRVWEYALGLEGLTLYEEQMRYANLCKLVDYAAYDAAQLRQRAVEQEARIVGRLEQQPYDLVDALNWILVHRPQVGGQLADHALTLICAAPIARSEATIARMLNSFLKKMEDMQWRALRKYRPIFDFLVHKYEPSIESPKLMVSNFHKLAGLKLHLLGYDRVPRALEMIADRLETTAGELDMYHLQLAFKSLDDLPVTFGRRLLRVLLKEVEGRLGRQSFQLNFLPLGRLTRTQLERFMQVFVGGGLYVRDCIYYINTEEGHQQLFSSPCFLAAFTQAFLRPPRAQENLRVDYMGYTSAARALLTHYPPDHELRPRIVEQMRAIHAAVFKGAEELSWRTFNGSLCALFNVFSLQVELQLFKKGEEVLRGLQEALKAFTAKRLHSGWKAKKHNQQMREVIVLHGGSPFPEVRGLVSRLLRAELEAAPFDSNLHPAWLFLLEGSRHAAHYRHLLAPLYAQLQGQDALALIDAYIRSPHKTPSLTLTIMRNLWDVNHCPAMMLKLAAGVPQLCFDDGLAGLLKQAAVILEDAATLVRLEDLQALSEGELVNLVRFCRRFAKDARIMSHKVLLLVVGREGTARVKEELQAQLPLELLSLAHELDYSDRELCIARLSQRLHSIPEVALNSPLASLRLLEAKLMLKASTAVDSGQLTKAVQALADRARVEEGMEERAKVMVVLLKLEAIGEVQLPAASLTQFKEVIKTSLEKERMEPSEVALLLGERLVEQCELTLPRLDHLKAILLNCLTLDTQEDAEFYLFVVRFGHRARAAELIERCLEPLSMLPLAPALVLALANVLKHHTTLYSPQLVQRLLDDTAGHLATSVHCLHVLYYVNTVCFDLPASHAYQCKQLLQEAERGLAAEAEAMMKEETPERERLLGLLTRTYKYYWVAFKNGQVSDTTLTIFHLNIRHVKTVLEGINLGSFDGLSFEIIHLMHLALFPAAASLQPTENGKRKFFRSRGEPEKYVAYKEDMRKMEELVRTQAVRSLSLEGQLHKLGVHYKQLKVKAERTYTFGEKKEGLQLHYRIFNGSQEHYIFVMTPKMRNSAGHFKGRVKLLQTLYASILATDPVIYDDQDPFIITLE